MKYINTFNTHSGHMEKYYGEEYIQPWVGYDTEDNCVTYNYGVLEGNIPLFLCMHNTVKDILGTGVQTNNNLLDDVYNDFKTEMAKKVFSNYSYYAGTSSGGQKPIYIYFENTCPSTNREHITLSFYGSIPVDDFETLDNEEDIYNYLCEHNELWPIEKSVSQCPEIE